MRTSTTLPPKPIVFHGREQLIAGAVALLTKPGTARLAVLGSGGMGKTTLSLALVHDPLVICCFGNARFFLSCEALVDGDTLVISLAKLLGLQPSVDLLTDVVTCFNALPRVVLVLDNFETVWLVGGGPVVAVEQLLGTLAQIPTLSLIITCRGSILPQFVSWSNSDSATLEPFSAQAALETFKDMTNKQLSKEEDKVARNLLDAVDRMPLAVSLLAQLANRGNSVTELFSRWIQERSALLCMHDTDRRHSVGTSISLSITMLCEADESHESLKLLGLCSMLPDGVRPEVFKSIQPLFNNIHRARDTLAAYSLINVGTDRVIKTLSPIRHLVLERHPPQLTHQEALHSIYFDIANRLPKVVNERYKEVAAEVTPEMGNLCSVLLTLIHRPSEQVVYSVRRFTSFSSLQQPTVTLASSLLPHLESHPKWKAICLRSIGESYIALHNYASAVDALIAAAELFRQTGDQSSEPRCRYAAGGAYRRLGDYERAALLLSEARVVYADTGEEFGEASCRAELGRLSRMKLDHTAAIAQLTAARTTFLSLNNTYNAAGCSQSIATVYLDQDQFDLALIELEFARSGFIEVGVLPQAAQCTRLLGAARRRKGDLNLADQLLKEANTYYERSRDNFGLASCIAELGFLRRDQERWEEAVDYLKSAHFLYQTLKLRSQSQECLKWSEYLESTMLRTARG